MTGKSVGDKYDYIEDASDTSDPASQWASRVYDHALNQSILLLEPPECLRYADPGNLITAVNRFPTEYEYVFARPPCLALRGVISEDLDDNYKEIPVRYLEAGDEIACVEYEDLLFKYLVRETVTTKWSDPLETVVIHVLAYHLCGPFKLGANERSYVRQLMELAIMAAKGRTQAALFDPNAAATMKSVFGV